MRAGRRRVADCVQNPRAAASVAALALAVSGCWPPLDDLEGSQDASSYAGVVLADAPVAYWRLGETEGTTAADQTGAFDGTYLDGVKLGASGAIAGDADAAIELDGQSGGVSIGNVLGFEGQAPFSIEVWLEPHAFGPYPRIFSKEYPGGEPRQGWDMILTSDPAVGFERYRDHNGDLIFQPYEEPTDAWAHFVGTYDGSRMVLFRDGAQIADDGAASQSLIPHEGSLMLGSAGGGSAVFEGKLDEIAIYDHALSPERVIAHYQAAGAK